MTMKQPSRYHAVHPLFYFYCFLLIIFSSFSHAGVTFYVNDFSGWQDDWENFTDRRIEIFPTTAANIALANERSTPPNANTGLGATLTFPEVETNFCRAFVVKTLEPGANFTFDDDEGAGNFPGFDNALSVGDIDNFENDDFEISFPPGETPAYAVSFGIQDSNSASGESVQVFGADNVLLATLNSLPSDLNFTIGIISTEPITRVVFNEDTGGDDIALKDFAFDRATANDSDSDGISDCEEVTALGSNPFAYDTDSDGLSDKEEIDVYGSSEQNPDTDGDGLVDGEEVARQTLIVGVGSTDSDSDNLSDGFEVNTLGTNPLLPDTDDDGVNDDIEVNNNLDPLHPDTDGDGLPDNTDPDPMLFDNATTVTDTNGGGASIDTHQLYTATHYLIAVSETDFDLDPSNIRAGRAILGEIREFAATRVSLIPGGWMRAEGQVLDIATHPKLFEILGNTYGGDGVVNFALPDLRGRTPMGAGAVPGRPFVALGQQRGTPSISLSSGQLPQHNHSIPTGDNTRNAGADVSISLEQPSLGLNFILARRGQFGNINTQGISEIRIWPGRNLPNTDWAFCHGQLLSIGQNNSLYSLIGNIYGGNGTTNFALPDLRARSVRIIGNTNLLGATTNSYETQLTSLQMPAHAHNAIPGSSVELGSTGAGTNLSNTQPSLSLRRLIVTEGVFPAEGSNSLGFGSQTLSEMRYYPSIFLIDGSGAISTENQLLPISSNTALFALIGISHGGDGRSVFNLPHGGGRVAVGTGSAPGLPNYTLGQIGGADTITPALANLATHQHPVSPTLIDSDNDSLFDAEEDLNNNGTQDPGETGLLNADSDNDGFNDGDEVNAGSNPLDDTSTPNTVVPIPLWVILIMMMSFTLIQARLNRKHL